jgi:hypothetical protein
MAFPAVYNFNYYRGDTYNFVINPKQTNGQPFPLNGFEDSGLFVIALTRGGEPEAIGTAEVDVPNSQVICSISASAGSLLTGNSYVYDVEVSNNSASPRVVFTLLTGNISVTQDVAQSE